MKLGPIALLEFHVMALMGIRSWWHRDMANFSYKYVRVALSLCICIQRFLPTSIK